MSEREPNKPQDRPRAQPGRVLRCDEWEDLIADALDESLSAADAAAFDRHARECVLCAQVLKETREGKSWMQYLAAAPEPPPALLQNILARTSRLTKGESASAAGPAVPRLGVARPASSARPAWRRMMLPRLSGIPGQVLEPRLMMTLAMAFFSLALTLNLAGIKLGDLRPSDFRPSRLRATLTRQYYATNEQVTKYYENLRLVYEMEARVRELRRSTEAMPVSAPSPRPSPNPAPRQPVRDGSGNSTGPKGQQVPPQPRSRRTPLNEEGVVPVEMVDNLPGVARRPEKPGVATVSAHVDPRGRSGKVKREVFRALRSITEDQAGRSLV